MIGAMIHDSATDDYLECTCICISNEAEEVSEHPLSFSVAVTVRSIIISILDTSVILFLHVVTDL